jgi:hypothetical protein
MDQQRSPIIVPHPNQGCADNKEQANRLHNSTRSTSRSQGNGNNNSFGGLTPGLDFRAAGILTVCLPLASNPEADGTRYPIDPEKFEATEAEIVRRFGGFQSWSIRGSWVDSAAGERYEDQLVKYKIYAVFTIETFAFLAEWLPTLEERFTQCSIFATFDSHAVIG